VQDADEWKVAKAFGVIEAVTDDEEIGDLEADVVRADRFPAARGLLEQNTDAEAQGVGGPEAGDDVAEGLASIEDVVDNEHITSTEVEPEFFGEDQGAGLGVGAVARDAEKIKFDRQSEVTEQVGQKKDGTVEQGDNDEVGAGGVALDLSSEAAHLGGDLGPGEQDPSDILAPAAGYPGAGNGRRGWWGALGRHGLMERERDPRSSGACRLGDP
jgi:hypothetical protein